MCVFFFLAWILTTDYCSVLIKTGCAAVRDTHSVLKTLPTHVDSDAWKQQRCSYGRHQSNTFACVNTEVLILFIYLFFCDIPRYY